MMVKFVFLNLDIFFNSIIVNNKAPITSGPILIHTF